MDLTKIFTVGGKSGLQKLVAQSKNGVIVESLEDGKRFNVPSNGKISSLEDISVFCLDGDKPLKEIFETIAVKNKYATIELPEEDGLKKALSVYVSNIDEERVYNSDIKKMFKWYNLLINNKLIVAEKETKAAKKETGEASAELPKDTKEKTTKTTAKKAAPPKTVKNNQVKKAVGGAKVAATKKTGAAKGK